MELLLQLGFSFILLYYHIYMLQIRSMSLLRMYLVTTAFSLSFSLPGRNALSSFLTPACLLASFAVSTPVYFRYFLFSTYPTACPSPAD